MSFEYDGMPQGDDWMEHYDRRNLVNGKDSFDIRLMQDLNEVGVRAYTVGDLNRAARSVPPAIPVFVDWLDHLDDRVPGEETPHRSALRRSLLTALDDPAAKGNRAAADAVYAQLQRTSPPLENHMQIRAMEILARIGTKNDYDRMLVLARRPDLDTGKRIALVRYLGRFRRPESREVALSYLPIEFVQQEAIRALGKIGTADDIDAITAYADDENPRVRRAVETALTKLQG
ncbi:HEAT repeat domain-containing protein OS=Tsukamurella paurometabola (strain ATCC 8368 / DSM/ CCUG 35730 / CIP 100753 / JCM 10117 / KCTC 9821 / NBRC 16120/ NCIMB 702349 / NCTC 13040) OX=521096 GN=Tpau_3457 PE=4 SV=1 [Tsukamurella paurometabola]|uniref:HEAT repeat domain-containing protein n=1 Tax=Tsukamurella paurometabola (strain ATCC 8368 / DSM 20162 / CCUG 35730 / CIP 100753 / JCM 10117 / KCTC 9821 / NBRC 16120 / NCIMB 702349 / NCTC 13040) TaxID=521096 RepID=D5UX21_TSUPD|nr:HEAT repeat domain-containing protein [Tsukamurella paurometabola]ADG80040.1 conserved hypothetical protein [Tsukamurella paurometabola DSM 20162]SUP38159.1 Uncharacterised protein [Tsukamurella paurometabola]